MVLCPILNFSCNSSQTSSKKASSLRVLWNHEMRGERGQIALYLTYVHAFGSGVDGKLERIAQQTPGAGDEHCIDEAQNPTEGKRKLRELLSVLERYVE